MSPSPDPCDYKANEEWFLWNLLSPFTVFLKVFSSMNHHKLNHLDHYFYSEGIL